MAKSNDEYEYTTDYNGEPGGYGWIPTGRDPKSGLNWYKRRKDGKRPVGIDPKSGMTIYK